MKALLAVLAAVAVGALAAPAAAQPDSVLDAEQRDGYRAALRAIRAGDWTGAAARLDATRAGPLHAALRAELFLAKGSPRAEAEPLLALLESAPELPQAAQLARLAATRGTATPLLPPEQRLVGLPGASRRNRAKSVAGDPVADALELLAEPLIKENRAAELEALVVAREALLSPDALTEWRQKVAWTHYVLGDDGSARRVALLARGGATDWAVQGEWTLGLAAWRQKDCAAAAEAFGQVAARAREPELQAGGHYWASRAELACKRPERVQPRLRSAAKLSETFYGLLAQSALGLPVKPLPVGTASASLGERPNLRAATALVEIGETQLAEQFIRHQARIGGRSDHATLLRLAGTLNLPAAQFWLAHNAPAGTHVAADARYPAPRWSPTRGWRVDKALVFAHTLQESGFRSQVVSPAGATGLMQVRPGTAGDIARARGDYFSPEQLRDPSANIEYGQSFLEQLRGDPATRGHLPKIIAAYNAGLVPVARWNASIRDGGDPLLYIESIPYWETRYYVPTVLRNYWVYKAKAGETAESLKQLAEGKWPKFPAAAAPHGVVTAASD